MENAWVSELIFTSLFVAFVLWTFSPFVFARKRFYTSLLYSQILSVLVGQRTDLASIIGCVTPAHRFLEATLSVCPCLPIWNTAWRSAGQVHRLSLSFCC